MFGMAIPFDPPPSSFAREVHRGPTNPLLAEWSRNCLANLPSSGVVFDATRPIGIIVTFK